MNIQTERRDIMENKIDFSVIGLVDENELKQLSGASEVNPRTTTLPCVTVGGAVATWIIEKSNDYCPTGACSTRC
jgi:hypothetical protein